MSEVQFKMYKNGACATEANNRHCLGVERPDGSVLPSSEGREPEAYIADLIVCNLPTNLVEKEQAYA